MASRPESFAARIISGDCHRRQKALTILEEQGFEEFAYYVVGHNVALFGSTPRRHNVLSKDYLLRDEHFHDDLLVKAILRPKVSSENIYKLVSHNHIDRLRSLPDLTAPSKSFVEVYSSDLWGTCFLPSRILNTIIAYSVRWHSTYMPFKGAYGEMAKWVGVFGRKARCGPDDDGYSYDKSPAIRQYLHDPYCFLMSLFIRGDNSLIDKLLENYPALRSYLPGTCELFLIDPNALIELNRIRKYITVGWAYDYAVLHYGNKKQYEFLKCENSYQYSKCAYRVHPKLLDIWV